MNLRQLLIRNKSAISLGVSLACAFMVISGLSPDEKPDLQSNTSRDSATQPARATEVKSERMAATVKHCHDGDTCRIVTAVGHMWMSVRLAGIDAPERSNKRQKSNGQPFGDESAEFLNRHIVDKQVELEQTDLDGYNRPVVIIWLNQRNINLELVENGYAEVYRGPAKRIDRAPFEAAETRARNSKKGIWSLAKKDRQSPSEYRKELRLREKH